MNTVSNICDEALNHLQSHHELYLKNQSACESSEEMRKCEI